MDRQPAILQGTIVVNDDEATGRQPVIKVSQPIDRGAIHIAIEPDQGEPLCSQLWQRLAEQPLQEYDLMVEQSYSQRRRQHEHARCQKC